MVYAENLLSFWKSGILVQARQRVPAGVAPNKTPSTKSPMSLSGRQHLKHIVIICCWRKKECTCASSGSHSPLEACAWHPLILSQAPSPFADVALYPLATVNHHCGYAYMLSP